MWPLPVPSKPFLVEERVGQHLTASSGVCSGVPVLKKSIVCGHFKQY